MRSTIIIVLIWRMMGVASLVVSTRQRSRVVSFTLVKSQDENTAGEIDLDPSGVTYYSPNIPLEDSRYAYSDEASAASIPIDLTASSTNEYSFFDEAIIYVRGGSGGQGASTYKKGKGGQDGPPDGGNGGRGGNVLLVVDDSLNTLAGLTSGWRPNSFGGSGAATSTPLKERRQSFRAENGYDGGRQVKNGRYGSDVTIRIPPGTVVQELIENADCSESLIDIGVVTKDEPELIVALGGDGGEGSGIGGTARGVKRPRMPPQGGERKIIKLTLKIVADVALVGVPNAGKSTFLTKAARRAISSSTPSRSRALIHINRVCGKTSRSISSKSFRLNLTRNPASQSSPFPSKASNLFTTTT